MEFISTPSTEERAKYYSLSACSEATVPQTCQNESCGAGFIARGTYFTYIPNEAGKFIGLKPFTELLISVNFCEKCR